MKSTIIIVDDDADDREAIRDAFAETHHDLNVIFHENGNKLLDYLQQTKAHDLPSLILLDLNMPGKTGQEILKEVKTNKNFCHIPIIVFSTSSAAKDRQASYKLGANCFVTKPDSYSALIDLTDWIARLWLTQ
jgi:CheY-like chemotaxis protein